MGLYIDPDFPADASSLFIDPKNPPRWHPDPRTVKWLRPGDFVHKNYTQVIVGGAGLLHSVFEKFWVDLEKSAKQIYLESKLFCVEA